MNWKLHAKNKFDEGIEQMSKESQNFVELLNQFNTSRGLVHGKILSHDDLLPEGGMWLLKLKDETEVLAETCSYQIDNSDIDYIWVEFNSSQKNIIIKIHKKNGNLEKQSLLSGKVVEYYPDGI